MAEDIVMPLSFTLTATSGLDGAPTFHAKGDFEPMPKLKVVTAEITQALPPPNGILKIEDPSGSYEIQSTPNFQEMVLVVRIEGEVKHPGSSKTEKFESTSKFEYHPPLKPKEKLRGTASFEHGPHAVKDVKAELDLS